MTDIGYAPTLCPAAPGHIAKRDKAITDAIVWRCQLCGKAWNTQREDIE